MSQKNSITVLAILCYLLSGAALAQSSFERVGERVTVAEQVAQDGMVTVPSTRIDSAIATMDDGTVGVGLHTEFYVNSSLIETTFTLSTIDPDGNVVHNDLSTISGGAPTSPSIVARADDTFVVTRPVRGVQTSFIDLMSQQYAREIGSSDFAPVGPEIRTTFGETECQQSLATTSQPGDSASYISDLRLMQICTNRSVYAASTSFGQTPAGDGPVVQSDIVEIATSDSGESEAPEAGTLTPSVTNGPGGKTFAMYGGQIQPQQGGLLYQPVLVQLGADMSVEDFWVYENNMPFSQGLGVCGHEDQPHLWLSIVDEDEMAKLFKVIDGEIVDTVELGNAVPHELSAINITDVACDPWGNVAVTWIGGETFDTPDTSDDIDVVSTAVVSAQGDILGLFEEQLDGGDFAVKASVAISPSGNVAATWSTFATGAFVQRYKVSGHLSLDGTQSGSFFSPFFNGEGYVFDIVESNGMPSVVVYYFTYLPDGSGKQAWLVGSAPIVDNTATVEVGIGEGGIFGPDFDPDDVNLISAGTVTVRFLGCGVARVMTESELFGSQDYIAQSLSGLPVGVDGSCSDQLAQSNKSATKAVDATQGGSVFAPTRNGEGFIFDIAQVSGQDTLVIYYFTYQPDGSGEMAWIVGSGPIDHDTNSAVATVAIAEGATFGSMFDPADVIFTEWGTLTVTWISCDEILVEYDGLWGMGSVTVQPLTGPLIGATGNCSL